MSVFYVDSSALVKRYLAEVGSAWVSSLLDPSAGHTIIVAAITRVETAAALAARQRAGGITLTERDRLMRLVLLHFDNEYRVVPVDTPLMAKAVDLTQQHRLRGYDAVQLAAALVVAAAISGLTIISADDDLNDAARAEGLAAENPQAHP
jgi:uncharacterized protein